MAVHARIALGEDIDAVARLCADAVNSLSARRGGTLFADETTPFDTAELNRRQRVATKLIVVAAREAELIGAALANEVSLEGSNPTRVTRVELLYVQAQQRRLGAARAMMALVEDWARARGSVGIDTSALPGDRATKSFLEQLGYKARLLVMHKALGR